MEGQPATATTNWRSILVIAAVVLAAWWVWRRAQNTKPNVPMQPNVTAAPVPPPGIPLTLAEKMARVIDTTIPVVMTSGSPVPYDEDEIRDVVQATLGRLNAMGESVSLIGTVSASKTVDSYKTVAYDVVFNAYDASANVGIMVKLAALLPVSGVMYVRAFRLFSDNENAVPGPGAASDPAGFAPYESALDVLSKLKVG